MRLDAGRVGLVVVGRDDQRRVGASLGGTAGQLDRVRGVVGAGAADQQHLVADLLAHRPQQDQRLLVGQGRRLAGRAGDHQAVRAVLEQVGRQLQRCGLVDGTALIERRRHRSKDSANLLHGAQSSFSRPTVKRSGRSATLRTASSTPGMKERRSIESWRRLSVCPSPPKITSW